MGEVYKKLSQWLDSTHCLIMGVNSGVSSMNRIFAILAILIVPVGCTAVKPAPTEKLARLPVVRVGDPIPSDTEYVVFYPAGHAFPIKLKTSGTLFSQENEIMSRATLSKDLYLYKYWASHDGVTWKSSHELLDVDFGGGFDAGGLHVNVRLETN